MIELDGLQGFKKKKAFVELLFPNRKLEFLDRFGFLDHLNYPCN